MPPATPCSTKKQWRLVLVGVLFWLDGLRPYLSMNLNKTMPVMLNVGEVIVFLFVADSVVEVIARAVAGFFDDDLHERPLHGAHRRCERLEVGADVEAALGEPHPITVGEGSRRRWRRRRAGEEGDAQRARQLVRAEAEVIVRRAKQGARGGDRLGKWDPVEGAGAGRGRCGAVLASQSVAVALPTEVMSGRSTTESPSPKLLESSWSTSTNVIAANFARAAERVRV